MNISNEMAFVILIITLIVIGDLVKTIRAINKNKAKMDEDFDRFEKVVNKKLWPEDFEPDVTHTEFDQEYHGRFYTEDGRSQPKE